MRGLLRWLFRICCDADNDDDDNDEDRNDDYDRDQRQFSSADFVAPSNECMTFVVRADVDHRVESGTILVGRSSSSSSSSPSSSSLHQTSRNMNTLPAEMDLSAECCHSETAAKIDPFETNQTILGLQEFFRRIRDRWRRYDSIEDVREAESTIAFASTPVVEKLSETSPPAPKSPLRTATSFSTCKEIPTICTDEVVLPGSMLQREMAKAMSRNLETYDDECVICMERFDAANPRMPTLCGCGENKTYFHLPCLYQWIEQSSDCPSCRQHLRWEEF